jgi:TonB-linked SusC/RagA family outer membrane protein
MKQKVFKKRQILWRLLGAAVICLYALPGLAQHTVSGTVSDALGTLPGVNIQIKGTTQGVASDIDGHYTIQVADANAVLIFSYIGYVQQEIIVGNRQTIDVILTEDSQALEEVVVIGYGTQKKVSLTGSVAALNPNDIRDIPAANLVNSLAGRLSGVTIKQSTGGKPGNAANIVIRARGTWNTTDPLYVIDGVAKDAASFNMINANEIESLSILKDAATAAIYGSRAANGVVMVTTKRGKEGRPVITYSGSVSAGTGFSVLPQRETAADRVAWTNDRAREVDVNPNSMSIPYNPTHGIRYWPTVFQQDGVTPVSSALFTPDEEEYYRTHSYDLLKEAWSTPLTASHAVSVSGGTEKVRYFVAGNFYDETGGVKTLKYKKYSVRSNVDAEIIHGLRAGLSVDLNNSQNDAPDGLGGDDAWALFYRLITYSPLIPAKVDGKYTSNGLGEGANFLRFNPLAVAEGASGSVNKNRRNSNYIATLAWDIPWVKGLNLRTTFNQSWTDSFEKQWHTPYLVYELKQTGMNNHIVTEEFTGASSVMPLAGPATSLNQRYDRSTSYQWNGFVSYNKTFNEKHAIDFLAGFEQSEGNGEWFKASMNNYEINKPYFIFGPADKSFYGIEGSGWEDARLSYLGRLNYAYDNRYLLDFTFRSDASVRFDPKHRWGHFPAVSAAWRVSEEAFFKDRIRFISQLKLRASFGLTGNDAVGGWQWLDAAKRADDEGKPYDLSYYGPSGGGSGGIKIGSIANPLITWEKSRTFETGLDIGFLDNMFTLSGGYFFRHTYDILGSQTGNLPDTFGGTLADSNYGKANSFGIDLELTFNKRLTKDANVWARGNFGWADNRLIEWAETGVPPHLSRIGKNWDRAYGQIQDGVIWEMTPNGDGTYNILTSTGNRYVVNHDYASKRGTSYDIEADNSYAMRPGFLFFKDIGGQTVDEEGNTIYTNTPDGYATNNFSDATWVMEHLNPPYNYGLLLGGDWKGLSLEVFLQGTAGNMASIQHPYASSGDWYGSAEGHWSVNHFSYENNPHGTYPLPSNFSGFYTLGENNQVLYSFWLRDASFIRLKTVTLSYTLEPKLVSKLGLSSARIHLTGNNLALLLNNLKVYDPEVAVSNNRLSGLRGEVLGTGISTYPLMRTVMLGLDISF